MSDGVLPDVLLPLTVPLSWIYRAGVTRRNRRFDAGLGIERLDVPVMSVGNLTVGGTGKTPVVMWLVEHLRGQGRRPVIAMRGYGAKRGEAGDEELEYRSRVPEVPVVANPDRVTAVRAFLADHPDYDCVVLDDGFQHRQLHRDLDLVLVDATRHGLGGRVLPAGRLREPINGLQRADAVVVTRARDEDTRLGERIAAAHGRAPMAWTHHDWDGIDRLGHGREEVSWLEGKRLLTMLGVGHPKSIETQLEAAGASIAARCPVRDHERYDESRVVTVRGLCEGVDALVVTGKDWVKLSRWIDPAQWPSAIVVPRLRVSFTLGEVALTKLIAERLSLANPRPRAYPAR